MLGIFNSLSLIFTFFPSDRRGVLDAATLQALQAGESVLEKERQLSEMILQLQMVREQLLAQQEHNKVRHSRCFTKNPIFFFSSQDVHNLNLYKLT